MDFHDKNGGKTMNNHEHIMVVNQLFYSFRVVHTGKTCFFGMNNGGLSMNKDLTMKNDGLSMEYGNFTGLSIKHVD